MTALAQPFPTARLIDADLLRLRRRRGLVVVTALLTVGAMAVTYGVIELLHVLDPAKHGPAGGIVNLGHGAFVAAGYALAAVATVVFAGSNPVPGVHLLVTTGLWVLVEVAFYYLLAVGLVCLIGSRSYAIGILLAWRLALTPILASISALGIVRELVPGVALQTLTPAALGNAARQGPAVPMSTLAVAGVLVAWVVALLAAGGVRDVTRDA